MEVPKRFNDHDKKKSIFKRGGGSGGERGGFGAVILLGGALATAALTSGFIVWKNMRNSRNKKLSNKQQQNKQDEANKCSDIEKHPRSTTKPKKVGFSEEIVEVQAEKASIETNGGTPADVVNSEFIIKNVIQSDEKFPSDPKNVINEAKNESIEEDINEEISKKGEDFQQVYVDKEPTPNGMGVVDDVEISEKKSELDENTQEEIVLDVVDKAIEEMMNNPVIDSGDHIAEQTEDEPNLNLEVKNKEKKDLEGSPCDDIKCREVIGRNETIYLEFVEKETNKIVSESLVAVDDKQEPEEEMLLEQCEAIQTNFHNLESSLSEPIDNLVEPKNVENVNEGDIKILVEQELISSYTSEVVKVDSDVTTEDYDSEEEEESETDLSDESEENSTLTQDSSPLSNSEAIWPVESLQDSTVELQQIELVDQELTGKIGEDKAIIKQVKPIPEDNFQSNGKKDSTTVELLMNSIMKTVVVEKKLLEDRVGSANVRRMIIAMLSILLSLACSSMLGSSFVKLCLIMFFTLVLSEIHGY